MTPATYALACELDDDLPLDVCPGCGAHLRVAPHCGMNHHEGARTWRDFYWPNAFGYATCEWTSEFLYARTLRRKWRLEYAAAHA